MRILTVYSPEDSGLIRLWQRSWAAQGWKTGIISPKELQGKTLQKAAALRKGSLCPVRAINYGLRPKKNPRRRVCTKYGAPGWEDSPLVLYPDNMDETQILAARELSPE